MLDAAFEEDDDERGDRTEKQRDEEPHQAAAALALGQPSIDERQCEPADCIVLHHVLMVVLRCAATTNLV
jgi:hypothetical protein